MQAVSDNWKKTHNRTLLNESYVELSMNIANPEVLAAAVSQDNGKIYISDSSKLVKGTSETLVPYCTLEQNIWCLDGNQKAIPESDYGDNGFVGDALSDDTCIFSAKKPTITITFNELPYISGLPGITINWSKTYGEFADSFAIKAYWANTEVSKKEVTGNRSVVSLILWEPGICDRLEIVVEKWCLPNHRARVEEIYVGINKVYGKSELFQYTHTQSVNPVSTSLPKMEIKFSIDNSDGEYDPYNKNGLSKYLDEQQEIKARYGLKMDDGSIEWIKAGTFYLSEWYAKQNGLTADFTARDIFEFMSAIYYDSITEIKERSLYDLATSVLQSAGIPLNRDGTVKWSIDDSLKTIYTTAPLPEDSLANCLQLIAHAGRCVMYQDREGILQIKSLRDEEHSGYPPLYYMDYTISSFSSYSDPELTLSKPIKQINTMIYTYTIVDNKIESTKEKSVRSVNLNGETITMDNPLVTNSSMAGDIAEWITKNDSSFRKLLDFSWRPDVRLDALDLIVNLRGDFVMDTVRMTEIDLSYNGSFRGKGKGVVMYNG